MDQEQEQVADEHLVHGGGEEYAANETIQSHQESSAIDQSKTKARVKLEQAQLNIQQLQGIQKDMEEYIVDWTKSTTLEQEKTNVAIDGLSRLQKERTRIEDTLKDAINDRNHMEISLGCAVKELKKVKEQKTEVTVSLEKVQREMEEVVKAKTEVEKELEDMRNRLEAYQIENTDIRRKLDEAQMENSQISKAVTDSLHDAIDVIKHYFLKEMNKLRNSCGVPSKGIENAYRRDSLVFYDNISDSISFQVIIILLGVLCAGGSPFLLLKSHHLAWRVAIGACLLFFIASGCAVYFRKKDALRNPLQYWLTPVLMNIPVTIISFLLTVYTSSLHEATWGYSLIGIIAFCILLLAQPVVDFGLLQLFSSFPYLMLITTNARKFYYGYIGLTVVHIVFFGCLGYFTKLENVKYGEGELITRAGEIEEEILKIKKKISRR